METKLTDVLLIILGAPWR